MSGARSPHRSVDDQDHFKAPEGETRLSRRTACPSRVCAQSWKRLRVFSTHAGLCAEARTAPRRPESSRARQVRGGRPGRETMSAGLAIGGAIEQPADEARRIATRGVEGYVDAEGSNALDRLPHRIRVALGPRGCQTLPTGGRPTLPGVSAEREELRRPVERLPDEEVPAVLAEVRRHVAAAGERPWPPAFFGACRAGRSDVRRGRRRSWAKASAARRDPLRSGPRVAAALTE